MEYLTLTILCMSLHWARAQVEDVIVSTVYGVVIGQAIPISDGKIINSFLGIPYAIPPVEDLRFTNPQEPEPWDEPFSASDFGDACMQPLFSSIQVTHFGWTRFSEDCLHLNIYAPERAEPDVLLPVMVWFHGGGYQGGANFMYPGYFLAERDVVVVSVNYRLGIMGFAYSGDGVVPGNMGLADQILALQFVQDNIAAFGGDADSVTIFGESAGAASAGLHLMSPLSAGLFHGAILQSGSDIGLWSLNGPEQMPENYLTQIAEQFNCSTEDSLQMVDCLRMLNARTLSNANFECTVGYVCGGFGPVIDGVVIPDYPIDLRERGEYNQVPEMIGCTEDENSIFVIASGPALNRSEFDEIIWNKVSRQSPSWPDPSCDEDVFKALQFYYTDWPYDEDPDRNWNMYVRMETDEGFGFTSDWQAKLHSGDGLPVYYYTYDYIPELLPIPEWLGAFHAIDIPAVFGWPYLVLEENKLALNHSQAAPLIELDFTDRDKQFTDFILTLWTNFAKFRNPTPEPVAGPDGSSITWVAYTESEFNYLLLDHPAQMSLNYRQQDYAFWREYLPYIIHGDDFRDVKKNYPLGFSLPSPCFECVQDFFKEFEDDSF